MGWGRTVPSPTYSSRGILEPFYLQEIVALVNDRKIIDLIILDDILCFEFCGSIVFRISVFIIFI